MKRMIATVCILIMSTLSYAQGVDISYVDNRFVDISGTPVTGEFNFSTSITEENANVRLSYGQLTGTAIYYYPNGKVKTIAHYKDGKKHGDWYQFNDAGNVIIQANYFENMKSGTWKIWNDSGQMVMKMKYHLNTKKGIGLGKKWGANGELKNKRKY